MKENKTIYVKRTQKDYSLSFKLGVVKEIEEENYPLEKQESNMVFRVTPRL